MQGDIQIRSVERSELGDTFLERAAALLVRAFGDWPRSEVGVPAREHLAWKLCGPWNAFPAGLVAEHGGALVGFRTLLVREALVHGETRLFLHFVDGATDPAWQRRGINSAIQDRMEAEFHPQFDLSIDDSTNETVQRQRVRLGTVHEFGNPVRRFIRPLSLAGLFRQRRGRRGLPHALAGLLADLVTGLSSAPRLVQPAVTNDYTIRTVSTCDGRFDGLCSEGLAGFEFALSRDAAFLNWRYADRRAGDFTIRIAERGSELAGYAVTNASTSEANLADIVVAPREPAAIAALIEDAVALARDAGAISLTCWLPARHPYAPALRRAGFAAFRRSTSLRYRAVSMPEEALSFLSRRDSSIHLTHGDTDLV